MDLIYKEEVFQIVGAAIEVHKELGNGFGEAVYQEAFEIELEDRCIPFESQKILPIHYKKRRLRKNYKTDLLVMKEIIVELKATERLVDHDQAQVLRYLNASKKNLGILINFGSKGKLEWKRMVLSNPS